MSTHSTTTTWDTKGYGWKAGVTHPTGMLSCLVMVLIFLFPQISIADEAVAALLAVNGVPYETGTLQEIFDFNSGSSADYTYDNLGMYQIQCYGLHLWLLGLQLLSPVNEVAGS